MYEIPVAVKDALKGGRHKKNYIIEVLNDDGTTDFTIDNDNIVQESVSIDERMDSGDDIKFGLCEGSSIQLQYFGFPNIYGKRIKVGLEVDYVDSGSIHQYTIPMGYFDIEKCARQASTGIMEATGYNKLQSKYLDQKANQILDDSYSQDYTLTLYDIMRTLLGDYQIAAERVPYDPGHPGPSFPTTIPSNNISVGPFIFTKTYGPETPLNAYMAGVSANQQFNISFNANFPRYSISVGPYVEIDTLKGTLEAFERNVVQYIKDLFDNSDIELVGSSGSVGDAVIDEICSNGGFYNILGVRIADSDGYVTTTTYYSNVDYEHGVAGVRPLSDISHRALGARHLLVINISNPAVMRLNPVDGAFIGFDGRITNVSETYSSEYTYTYYDEDNVRREAEWHPVKYSNGDEYTDDVTGIALYEVALSDAEKLTVKISDMPDFTLREIVSGIYETLCQYGQLDRVTDLFHGVELNRSRLYPAEDLYPDNQLYPGGSAMSANMMMYSQLWADDGNVRNWRYLIITYKTLNGNNEEVEATLQRTIDEHGTDNYNMSDNWIFKNMVWTAADVGAYADAMVAKMTGITWFPFEMWLPGLPYIETGDEIEVTVNGNTYPTYVLQRQLQGVQNLQDTYINGTLDII